MPRLLTQIRTFRVGLCNKIQHPLQNYHPISNHYSLILSLLVFFNGPLTLAFLKDYIEGVGSGVPNTLEALEYCLSGSEGLCAILLFATLSSKFSLHCREKDQGASFKCIITAGRSREIGQLLSRLLKDICSFKPQQAMLFCFHTTSWEL